LAVPCTPRSVPTRSTQALDLGADYAINYKTDRFEGRLRKLTKKQGVDVVFEHVGVDTWEGSMFSLKIGGRLVTCGSTSGVMAEINLFQLFQRQLRLIGSFGCAMRNIETYKNWRLAWSSRFLTWKFRWMRSAGVGTCKTARCSARLSSRRCNAGVVTSPQHALASLPGQIGRNWSAGDSPVFFLPRTDIRSVCCVAMSPAFG
jgi:hypothetical protein